jgi:hypothetical protein
MVEVEGEGNELLEQISRDKVTADAGDKNDAERAARRFRKEKRATRRRNTTERQRHVRRDLDAEFAAAGERGFQTPIANITGIIAILATSCTTSSTTGSEGMAAARSSEPCSVGTGQ